MTNHDRSQLNPMDFNNTTPMDADTLALSDAQAGSKSQHRFNAQQENFSAFSGTNSNDESDFDAQMAELANYSSLHSHPLSNGGGYPMTFAMQQHMQHQQPVKALYHPKLGWFFPAYHDPELGPYLPANGPSTFIPSSNTYPGAQGQIPLASTLHGSQLEEQQNNDSLAPPLPGLVGDPVLDSFRFEDFVAEPESQREKPANLSLKGTKRGRPRSMTESLMIVEECTCADREPSEQPRRPMNAFMLFRQAKSASVNADLGGHSTNPAASKVIAKLWSDLKEKKPKEAQKYRDAALRKADEHKRKHPEYVYRGNRALIKFANRYGYMDCQCGAFKANEAANLGRHKAPALTTVLKGGGFGGYEADAEPTPASGRSRKRARHDLDQSQTDGPGNLAEPKRSARPTRISASRRVRYAEKDGDGENDDDDEDAYEQDQDEDTVTPRQHRPAPIKTTTSGASPFPQQTPTQLPKAKTPSPRRKTKTPPPSNTYNHYINGDNDSYGLDTDFDYEGFDFGDGVPTQDQNGHQQPSMYTGEYSDLGGASASQGYEHVAQQPLRRSLRSSTESQRARRAAVVFEEMTANDDYTHQTTTRVTRSSGGSGKGRGSGSSGKGNATPTAASRRSPRRSK